MALKPLQDRIVIKVIEDTEQTSGGIFIPDSAKEKPQKGEVVAVGEGKASHPSIDAAHKLELKEGEPLHVVLYANAKNLEGAKLNVTDFHTRSSRIGITK